MANVAKSQDKRWLILAVLGLAQLMVVLDATVVNIALPPLLLGGRISDIFGRKWTFVVGLIAFAFASAVGGAAAVPVEAAAADASG